MQRTERAQAGLTSPRFWTRLLCCDVVNLQVNLYVSVPPFYLPGTGKESLGDP